MSNCEGLIGFYVGTVLSVIFFYDVGAVGDRKPKPEVEEEALGAETTLRDEKVVSEKESPVGLSHTN